MIDINYVGNIKSVFKNTNFNINVSAVAGSGKTTLLLNLLNLVPKNSTCSFFAFNNFIVNELKERNVVEGIHITTLHSYGWHGILDRYGYKVKMNPHKVIAKTEKLFKKLQTATEKQKRYCFYIVPKVVDLMRSNLIENNEDAIEDICNYHDLFVTDFEIAIIKAVFELTIKDKSQFDFTDMIYQPLIDPTIRLKKFDYVFCDESQDFSAAQQAIIKKSINRKGRLITVGDERQAIYGFAGADANSYGNLANINGKSVRMPLSVCYRCDKKIISAAQEIVPAIKHHPKAGEGEVAYGRLSDLQYGDWILCRNLKPLVEACLWLLKNKVKAKIKGKDIGEGLISLINKTGAKTTDTLLRLLEKEQDKLLKKLQDRGIKNASTHPKMELLTNKIEVIEFLCEEIDKVITLKELIKNIFSDKVEGIMLSTIHKSKGLENDKVFFLCPELIPSRFATQPWQVEQEMNLKYVCITRARHSLIYVDKNAFIEDLKSSISIK